MLNMRPEDIERLSDVLVPVCPSEAEFGGMITNNRYLPITLSLCPVCVWVETCDTSPHRPKHMFFRKIFAFITPSTRDNYFHAAPRGHTAVYTTPPILPTGGMKSLRGRGGGMRWGCSALRTKS